MKTKSFLVFIILFFFDRGFAQYPPNTISLESSNLPILVINTSGQNIQDEPKITANLSLINNSILPNHPTDSGNIYTGLIGIELRGSSSLSYPKKSFAFELRDSGGDDLDLSILGMASESDWSLISNWVDRSLIKNALIYKMYEDIHDGYAVKTRFCEVILNDIHIGVYLLTEKIKRSKNRLDINKLKDSELSGEDLTGGYIVKNDNLSGTGNSFYWFSINEYTGNKPFIVQYPKSDNLQTEQFNYIKKYFYDFETALNSNSFMDPLTGYSRFINVQSFVDYFWIQEFSRNTDGFRGSVYFSKDKNKKLYIGPIWDFDESFRYNYFCSNRLDGWLHEGDCRNDAFLFWWSRLREDCEFGNLAESRFEELSSSVFNNIYVAHKVDSFQTLLQSAAYRDQQIWDLDHYFIQETNFIKTFCSQRLTWLNSNYRNVNRSKPSSINVSNSNPTFQEVVDVSSPSCEYGGANMWTWSANSFVGEYPVGMPSIAIPISDTTQLFSSCIYSNGCESNAVKTTIVYDSDQCNDGIMAGINVSPYNVFRSNEIISIDTPIPEESQTLYTSEKSILLLPGFITNQDPKVIRMEINDCQN